jgi:hypothetical protein
VRGHLAGVDRVVRHGLQALVLGPERDRVRLDGRVAPGGHRRDEAGVQPPAEERRDRDVGDEMRGDRLLDHLREVRRGLPGGEPGLLDRVPVPLRGGDGAALPAPPGARRELHHAVDRGDLLGDEVEQRGGDEGPRVHSELGPDGGDQGLELGGEDDAVAARHHVEGLDPQRVAGEQQARVPLVEEREGEHPAEPRQGVRPPAAQRLEDDLGVRLGDEPDAVALEDLPEFAVVVELAVVAEPEPVLDERLVGLGGQVDDRQPPVTELDRRVPPRRGADADGVRPAVGDPLDHGPDHAVPVRLAVRPGDAAHVRRPGGRGPRPPPCPAARSRAA